MKTEEKLGLTSKKSFNKNALKNSKKKKIKESYKRLQIKSKGLLSKIKLDKILISCIDLITLL